MSRDDPRRRYLSAYAWSAAIETRFSDMDLNFHLNNVAVANLYEEGRVRFNWQLRERYAAVGRPRFVVARIEIDYLDEGKYRAPTTVAASVVSTGTSSWRLAMGLFQNGGCIGLCDSVMVHRGEAGPAPLPEALRSVLGDFMPRA